MTQNRHTQPATSLWKLKLAQYNVGIFLVIAIAAIAVTLVMEGRKSSMPAGDSSVWLGVETVELTTALKEQYSIHSPAGLLVSRIFTGSPAAIAGIKTGDVLRMWDGVSITSQGQLQRLMNGAVPSQSARLTLNRGGKPIQIYIELGYRPGRF